MNETRNTLCVIIRSVNERTEALCQNIVKAQLGSDINIALIKNKSFGVAQNESIERAIEFNTKWAIFLDADVLLKKDAISEMVNVAEATTKPFYMLNFRILDFGFSCLTYGVHLYDAEYFPLAVKYCGSAIKEQRPESYICQRIAKHHKIPSLAAELIVGLHGYEQWHEDVYRTMFVRAVKFSHRFEFLFETVYDRYLIDPSNTDNFLLLHAFLDGTMYRQKSTFAPLEKEFYKDFFNRNKAISFLQEKNPLELNIEIIEEIINNYKPNDLCNKNINWLCPSGYITEYRISRIKKIKKKVKDFYKRIKSCYRLLFFRDVSGNE